MTIYLKLCQMFALNDTGLASWHSTKPQNAYRNLQKLENTYNPDMHCALVAQYTCGRVTRESNGNEN